LLANKEIWVKELISLQEQIIYYSGHEALWSYRRFLVSICYGEGIIDITTELDFIDECICNEKCENFLDQRNFALNYLYYLRNLVKQSNPSGFENSHTGKLIYTLLAKHKHILPYNLAAIITY